MELAAGGTLWQLINGGFVYPEHLAATLLRNVLQAVGFMHSRSVVHCDLRPGNILFTSQLPGKTCKELLRHPNLLTDIKVGGFTKAALARGDGLYGLTHISGSPHYMAPEVVDTLYYRTDGRGYGTPCDIWAVGVIAYFVPTRWLPFLGKEKKQLFEKIVFGRWEFRDNPETQLSFEYKKFVRGLLEQNPSKRFTAEQALKHQWITWSPVQTFNPEPKPDPQNLQEVASALQVSHRAGVQMDGYAGSELDLCL